MKTTFCISVALFALAPAQAQLFRPAAVQGALLGSVAGAVIGHNSGDLRHNAWKGAALGAGAGLLLGQAFGNSPAPVRYGADTVPAGAYVYRDSPYVFTGYRRGHAYPDAWSRHHGRGHFRPGISYYPGYDDRFHPTAHPYSYGTYGYYRSGPNAARGLWLGALAGGILGHNSGSFRHDTWRGAAWGAGTGWLLGSLADARQRATAYEAPYVVTTAPAVHAPAAPQPQPVTIINNYYNAPATPMSAANGLFGRR